MAQATALDSLIEFARGQRDDALSRLAASLSAARALKDQLALLTAYRSEYAARLAATLRSGLTVEQLRGFRLFIDKLDLAIAHQQQVMHSQSEQQQLHRADWAQRESRLQGYATLRGRRQAVAAARSRREEQRGGDEQGRRAAARTTED